MELRSGDGVRDRVTLLCCGCRGPCGAGGTFACDGGDRCDWNECGLCETNDGCDGTGGKGCEWVECVTMTDGAGDGEGDEEGDGVCEEPAPPKFICGGSRCT
jgi:hypothetical protein